MRIIIEAMVVGLISALVGFIISYISMGKNARNFEHWGSVLATFFLSGVIVHFTCEMLGINSWQARSRPRADGF
jgi:hypothetical protein